MASGDAVIGMESISDDAAITIKPSAGIEWIIHNLFIPDNAAEDGVDVAIVSATGSIVVITALSSLFQHNFHVTNSQWITMTNKTGSTALLGYDGIVVK